jgi:hypothetical protein
MHIGAFGAVVDILLGVTELASTVDSAAFTAT